MHFSPEFYHFFHITSKYHSQHPNHGCHQPTFFL